MAPQTRLVFGGVENGRGGVTWASEGRLPKPGSQISA